MIKLDARRARGALKREPKGGEMITDLPLYAAFPCGYYSVSMSPPLIPLSRFRVAYLILLHILDWTRGEHAVP